MFNLILLILLIGGLCVTIFMYGYAFFVLMLFIVEFLFEDKTE